jgi:hypothetical protein
VVDSYTPKLPGKMSTALIEQLKHTTIMASVFVVSQSTFDAVAAADDEWDEMFEHIETHRALDMHSFHGGVDHVEIYPKKIVFYDRGCNGRGKNLVIMRDKTRVGPENHPICLK